MAKLANALKRGLRGATGSRGPQGERGEPAAKERILAAVADQFAEIRKQLDDQLVRTGQIQADLDLQRRDTIDLRQQVRVVQALLKKSLAS